MLTAALIGYGKWGKKYFDILNHLNNQKILNFCYISRSNYKKKISEKKNLSLQTISNQSIFKKKIDILFVASPPDTHLFFSKKAVKYNIPILIEKPLTLDFNSTNEIKNLLNKKKSIFLVNHQHLMSPYFKKLKKLVNNKKIIKIYSEAHGIGPKRNYSILWDWIPHDLSMIFDLLGGNKKIKFLSLTKKIKNKGYERWNIKFMIDHIHININIGNNFKKKTRVFSIFEKNGNIITLNDQNLPQYKLRYNNQYIQVSHSYPLQNKIKYFINLTNKKKSRKLRENEYMNDINLSLKIAKTVEKIYYHK